MRCLFRRSNRAFHRRRGATTVEFAFTVPVFFVVLFSCLEISRMNMIRQTANNAAYEAVRACIVPGAKNSEGVAAATTLLKSIGVHGYTVTVSPDEIKDTTETVTATVVVPFASNTWGKSFLKSRGSASVTCTMTRDWVVSTRSASP
jgi:Flp pilus assembly protein TadG